MDKGVFINPFTRTPGEGGITGVALIAGGGGAYAFGAGAGCVMYESGRLECWADAFHNGLSAPVTFNNSKPGPFLQLDAALNTTFVDAVVKEADVFACKATQDFVCLACPDGYSCDGTQALKCSCGSNGVDEFYRIPGTQCNLTHVDDVICAVCPAGFWCIDDLKYQCGVNSMSAEGSNNQSACVCIPGYFGPDGGEACSECPVNSFCPGARQSSTATRTQSPSTSLTAPRTATVAWGTSASSWTRMAPCATSARPTNTARAALWSSSAWTRKCASLPGPT